MFALLKFDCRAAVLGTAMSSYSHPIKNVFNIFCLQVLYLTIAPAALSGSCLSKRLILTGNLFHEIF